MGFISALNDAVKGRSITEDCSTSQPVQALVEVLKKMRAWVDAIPPKQQSLRYGNPAYRYACHLALTAAELASFEASMGQCALSAALWQHSLRCRNTAHSTQQDRKFCPCERYPLHADECGTWSAVIMGILWTRLMCHICCVMTCHCISFQELILTSYLCPYLLCSLRHR